MRPALMAHAFWILLLSVVAAAVPWKRISIHDEDCKVNGVTCKERDAVQFFDNNPSGTAGAIIPVRLPHQENSAVLHYLAFRVYRTNPAYMSPAWVIKAGPNREADIEFAELCLKERLPDLGLDTPQPSSRRGQEAK